MIEQQIAEATECDFKVALETRKPKSWLKSVSAFSNGIGGTLLFGISDDRKPVGLSNVQKDAEARFLTNAGKLMTDQHTVYNSRMFCTRWNGLGKGSIFDDALDDKEYDIYIIRSMRRNPVIADLFHRMKYMELAYAKSSAKPKNYLDIQRHISLNFPQQRQISGSS